jgi:hypothetical protein
MICRRRGSAMALKTSDAADALDMLALYSHSGICQGAILMNSAAALCFLRFSTILFGYATPPGHNRHHTPAEKS